MINTQTRKFTCWVLLHSFVALLFLQGVPRDAGAATTPAPPRAALSPLTPVENCNDPLASVANQIPANLMILIDTSGSMEENPDNIGLRTGADDPRSKMDILKRALTKLIAENSDKINIGLSTYNQRYYNSASNQVTIEYDYDFLFAQDALGQLVSATPGNLTLRTGDPTTGLLTLVKFTDHDGDLKSEYWYDVGNDGSFDVGTDYNLVGPYLPWSDYVGGNYTSGFYQWLWTRSPTIPPSDNANLLDPTNLDGDPPSDRLRYADAHAAGIALRDLTWAAYDTQDANGDSTNDIVDPWDGTRQLVGVFLDNGLVYKDLGGDLSACGQALGELDTTDGAQFKDGAAVISQDSGMDDNWQFHATITPDSLVPTNPALSLINDKLAYQNSAVTLGGVGPDITADSTSPEYAGLVAKGNTPLIESMYCTFDFFKSLTGAADTRNSSLPAPAVWTPRSGEPSTITEDTRSFFNNGCRKNFLIVITDGKQSSGPVCPLPGTIDNDPLAYIDNMMLGDATDTTGTVWGLTDLGVKVLVVGFSLAADGISQVNRIAFDSDLDQVDDRFDPTHLEEDTINDTNGDGRSDPFLATDEPTLLTSLQSAFAAVAAGKFNSSPPVLATDVEVITGHTSTNRYGNSEVRVNQNILVTSFAELPSFKGHLQGFRLFDYDSSHNVVIPNPPTLLWDAGARTRSRSLVLTSFEAGGGGLTRTEFLPRDVIQAGADGTLFGSTLGQYGQVTTDMAAGNDFVVGFNDTDWAVLIRWVRDSYGLETAPGVGAMGAPILGSAAVVTPPLQEPAPDSEYVRYADDNFNRPTIIYQAADDGMIHAFYAGLPNDGTLNPGNLRLTWDDGYGSKFYYGGDELWAYVPNGILNDLIKFDAAQDTTFSTQNPVDVRRFSQGTYVVGQTVTNHRYLINGDIVTSDVKIDVGNGLEWRTVIMGGYGPGNEGFWCIDVTDPFNPTQLWDTDEHWTSTEQETLGLTYSTPRIGKIKILDAGIPTTKYVAFAGSGFHHARESSAADPNEANCGDGDCSDNRGRTFYIIEMETGDLLYSYLTDDVADPLDNENKLLGGVTIVDENLDGFIDDAYVGDLEGRIWKFAIDNNAGTVAPTAAYGPNVPHFFDDDPALQAANLDANHSMLSTGNPDANTSAQPITITPSGTLQYYSDGTSSGYAPLVFFGTGGDNCITLSSGEFNFVDGLIDPDSLGVIDPKGKRFCLGSIPLLNLSQDERLVGNPVVLGTQAFITTFQKDPADPCSKGTGFAYIIDFGDCLTSGGFAGTIPSSDITNLAGTPVTPGSASASIGEGVPAGIAGGPGGVYVLSEGGSITAIQGGGAGTPGTGPGQINPQQRVGTAGQVWREEER
ncbi:MAG: hypothetical protein HYX75_13945 [Acidobacteria bacterium]|nr:hypothetical protein [Acidobacteriota bacterium]